MKRVGNLSTQVFEFENLYRAARRALRGRRAQGACARFYFNLERELLILQQELRDESYRPRPYRVFEIREPKIRQICSSDIRDRVVHHAVCRWLEPVFERRLIAETYACRVGKGSHRALRQCRHLARGHHYYLKCDVQKYFESIDHGQLKRLIRRVLKDPPLLRLLDRIIDHPVPGGTAGRGLPIGNLTSQHFANLFLGELDHFLKDRRRVPGYLRYMDDFILFDDCKERLRSHYDEIVGFLGERSLQLKDKVTRLAPVSEGVPFLGFRVFAGMVRVQRPNLVRWRRNIRKKEDLWFSGRLTEAELAASVASSAAHLAAAGVLEVRRKEFHESLRWV